jgi:hypothetical protein
VVAVNKWDLEDDKQEKLAELKEMFETPSAAAARRAAGHRLGQDRQGPRPAARRDPARMTSGTAASPPRG